MLYGYGILLVMSIILLILTGYVVYLLLTQPIKTLGFVFKGTVLLILGLLVWFGLFYWVTL